MFGNIRVYDYIFHSADKSQSMTLNLTFAAILSESLFFNF